MDKRELFVKLENKYKELYDSYKPLREEVMAFEGGTEYEEYNSLTEDTVKEIMFPEQHKMYAELAEMEPKLEAFEREILNIAQGFLKQLNEEIKAFENKIEVNKKHIEKLEQEIQAKKQELEALKKTEAYINGDEEIILKVEDLESEINAKISRKEEIEKRISSYEKELEAAKREKEELVADYPELEAGKQKAPQKEEEQDDKEHQEGADNNSESNKENEEEKEKVPEQEKENEKVVYASVPHSSEKKEETISEEEQEEVEEIDQEEKKCTKEEFKELVAKAKKGNLNDKEFDKLVNIMKDPKSYGEYGITTGLVFNNSKGIFKALENSVTSPKKLAKEIKEIFAKEMVGELEDKELLEKISKLEVEGLDDNQKALLGKVKSTLSKNESLEQAKVVRDKIALEKNEKRWGWLMDFKEEKDRLAGLAEPSKELERNEEVKTSESPKAVAGIPGLEELNKTEEEQEKSYSESLTAPHTAEIEEQDHDSV